ncbi:DASH complex subunit Duo1 domain-containing protein [Trichoderma sp. SZMC 28013]
MADHMDVDDDDADLWTSPVKNPSSERPKTPKTPRTPRTPKTPPGNDRQSEPLDREAMLKRELEGVRTINRVIEGVIGTLQRTGSNMDSVSKTVSNASTLLNTWTRILSQTEHNQRLILDPTWKGATNDLAEIEAEALRKQQEEARKAAEEEERKEELRRRREEEELRRKLPASASARGARGSTAGLRGARGRTRVATASSRMRSRSSSRIATSSGYSGSSTISASSSRGTSGIGRGLGTTRSRYNRAK